MNELFTYNNDNEQIKIVWKKTCKLVCDMLNKQQSTISTLKEENDILKQKLRKNYIANKQYEEMKRLQKENEQLKEEIDELKQKEEVLNKIWRTYLENNE